MNGEARALQALEKLAEHEKECGVRWGEATGELRALKKEVREHAKRWEKLAWCVVTAFLAFAVGSFISVLS